MSEDTPAVHCNHTKMVPLLELVAHPLNPNHHPQEQVSLLSKIIKSHGWRSPIVVSARSGYVIKGHGRLMAAVVGGFAEVPVDFQDYDSEAEEWADMVADNRIAELSVMEDRKLRDVMSELAGIGYNLELTGFDNQSIEQILRIDDSDIDLDLAGKDSSPDEDQSNDLVECPECSFKFEIKTK